MMYKALLALSLLIGSQLATAQEDKYQEGVHFFKIDQVPAQTGAAYVEVTEIFSYACSHCNTFEPYMQSWKKKKADNVKLNRISVAFGRKSWEMMARGYIAAEMMGIVEESHIGMMDAIWKQGKQFRSLDELADFYSGFGVEKSAFIANFQSIEPRLFSAVLSGKRFIKITPIMIAGNSIDAITATISPPIFS